MLATAPPAVKNQPVPGYPTFIPANPQPIASLIKDTDAYPQNGRKIPRVYQELELRGTVFKNRLFAVCCLVRSRDEHGSFIRLLRRRCASVCRTAVVLPTYSKLTMSFRRLI